MKQLKRGHTASKWPVQASGIFFHFNTSAYALIREVRWKDSELSRKGVSYYKIMIFWNM